MTIKSHPKPAVDFESDNHMNNQQVCIDCLKPRSNKNERECKKYGCNYFYMPNY